MRLTLLRTISRIIGITLILCAFGFAAILVMVLLTEGWRGSGWVPFIFVAIAVGLILAGWHYFRAEPDGSEGAKLPDPVLNSLVNHRNQLKMLALGGLGLTLVAFGAACLGNRAYWPLLPLGVGALVLRSLGSKIAGPKRLGNRDWQRVPEWLRGLFTLAKKTADVAFLLVTAIFAYWNLRHPASGIEIRGLRLAFQLVLYVEIAFLYALESLFFEYGELRSDGPG